MAWHSSTFVSGDARSLLTMRSLAYGLMALSLFLGISNALVPRLTTKGLRQSFPHFNRRNMQSRRFHGFESDVNRRKTATVMEAGGFKVGVVGVTGAVGMEILGVLSKRNFPTSSLHAFASAKSAGKVVRTDGFGDIVVEEFSLDKAREMDVVFLAVDGDFAAAWAEKIAQENGPFVIDNSSHFRYKDGIPLIIPEINGDECKQNKLIANPNCTTAIALMAIFPLFKEFGLKRMIMSTYQVNIFSSPW